MIPGALAVLYNPSEAHIQNVLRLRLLVEHVVAVDNSLVSDLQLHKRIQAGGIEILSNFNAGGVAGAYNRGLEKLIEKGCRLLFIFDQDSEVPEDYFAQMLDACPCPGQSTFPDRSEDLRRQRQPLSSGACRPQV